MSQRIIFQQHATIRMFQRQISHDEVLQVLTTGEIIADYPNDKPYPSRLMLGWNGTRPIHVVAANDTAIQATRVITVYEPDPNEWEPDFRRRKP